MLAAAVAILGSSNANHHLPQMSQPRDVAHLVAGVLTLEERAELARRVAAIPPAPKEWTDDAGACAEPGEPPAALDPAAVQREVRWYIRREVKHIRKEIASRRPPRTRQLRRPSSRARRVARRASRQRARAPSGDPDEPEPPGLVGRLPSALARPLFGGER
jgi:hypothetical protein